MALASQRAFDNEASRRDAGKLPDTTTITTREALAWVTVEGARMLKMDDRIGTLAPGKQADLVVIDAEALNMWPVHDPVASVVTQAGLANVEAVMIAGRWRKRAGRLLDVDLAATRRALAASGGRIMDALRARAH
jgi:cytosine/adenosine deaminase-related metal-dependent hydrolase